MFLVDFEQHPSDDLKVISAFGSRSEAVSVSDGSDEQEFDTHKGERSLDCC